MTNYTDNIGKRKNTLRVFDKTISDSLINVTQISYDAEGEVELIVGFTGYSKEPVAIRPTIHTHLINNTGLKDKNNKEIYEGDIISYFYLDIHEQQSHPDCAPEINEFVVIQLKGIVTFEQGCFVLKNKKNDYSSPLMQAGLGDLKFLQAYFDCEDGIYSDYNGNEINDSVIGIEVIGNVFEHSDLLPQPTND